MCPKVHIAELRMAPRYSHPYALTLTPWHPDASLVPTGQVGEGRRTGVESGRPHLATTLSCLSFSSCFLRVSSRMESGPSAAHRGASALPIPGPRSHAHLLPPDSPDETANGEKEVFWVTMKLSIKSPAQGEAMTISR